MLTKKNAVLVLIFFLKKKTPLHLRNDALQGIPLEEAVFLKYFGRKTFFFLRKNNSYSPEEQCARSNTVNVGRKKKLLFT